MIKSRKILLLLAFFSISVLLTDCTPKITEEQLALLKELRRKEKSLNDEIAKVNSEIPKVESEVKARLQELKDCNDKKDFITQKLSQWPNVWPDYTPVESIPEVDPAQKK